MRDSHPVRANRLELGTRIPLASANENPFRYFNSSPEVISLAVMMYIRYPLSLRQVEDLLADRGIVICHETVRFWWNRFDPMFAAEIRKRRIHHRSYLRWRWHLDEVFVRINGATHYLWRAVDHKGEVLEVFATKRRDRKVAERFNRFEQLAKSEMIYGPMSDREKTSYGHTIRWHPITDDEYFSLLWSAPISTSTSMY